MKISNSLFNFLVKNAFICQLSHINQPPNLIQSKQKQRGKFTDYMIQNNRTILEIEYSKINTKILKISEDFLKDIPVFNEFNHQPSRKNTKKSIIERNTVKDLTNMPEFHFD